MTTEAGTREMGGSRRKERSYPVADEDWQDGVTVAAPRFARVVTVHNEEGCRERESLTGDKEEENRGGCSTSTTTLRREVVE